MEKTALILRSNYEALLENWENRIRQEVSSSTKSPRITVLDHIPAVLDDLIEIVKQHEAGTDPFENKEYLRIVDSSTEHGKHRALTRAYTVDEIVSEYIIFHRVITDLLVDHQIGDAAPYNLIKYVVETAILKSVQSFSEAIQEMQQKLVATLAHDIRNPLAAARLAIEMINPDNSSERTLRVKKMSFDSINKALTMLEDLLESATVQAGEGMLLDFKETNLLEDILDVYNEASLIYDEEIILENTSQQINGVFDGTSIRRLLENLVTNAVKYGESGKPITIRTEEKKNSVHLAVHNYGPAIPEEKQAEIFKYLEHGEARKATKLRSWGIGLALVKMVTLAHGGKVLLKSEEGFGTEFQVILKKNANNSGKVKTQLNFAKL